MTKTHISHLVEGGVFILQYVDDTILFIKHDWEKAVKMKLIHNSFEQLSSLKAKLPQSEIFLFKNTKDLKH
jgi:hypothetical protein